MTVRERSEAVSTPPARELVSMSGREIWLWDAANGRLIRRIRAPQAVFSIALSPDGKLLTGSLKEDWTIRATQLPFP